MIKTSDPGLQRAVAPDAEDALGLTPEQKTSLLHSVAQGEAQYQAGEAIPGAEVLAWIRSWGTVKPLPKPKPKPQAPRP